MADSGGPDTIREHTGGGRDASSSGLVPYQPEEMEQGANAASTGEETMGMDGKAEDADVDVDEDTTAAKAGGVSLLKPKSTSAQMISVRQMMEAKSEKNDDSDQELIDEDEEGFFVDPSIVEFSEKESKRWWIIMIVALVGWILFVAFYVPFMVYLAKPTGLAESSWTYNGYSTNPDLWPNISSNFDACSGLGSLQSPFNIDLEFVRYVGSGGLSEALGVSSFLFHSTGTFEYSRANGLPLFTCTQERQCGYLTWQGQDYFLDTISLHSRSQTSLDGLYLPLELEMVHVAPSASNGDGEQEPEYAVLNVLYQENALINSTALNPMWWDVLENPGAIVTNLQVNALYELFAGFVVTTGSLTQPPCTPNVLWFLPDQLSLVSTDQINWLVGILQYPYNVRPQQPLADRSIIYYPSSGEDIRDIITGIQ